jgi:hypothetical protein
MKYLTIILYLSFCTLLTVYIAFVRQIYRVFLGIRNNTGCDSCTYFETYAVKQQTERQKIQGHILRVYCKGLIKEYSN